MSRKSSRRVAWSLAQVAVLGIAWAACGTLAAEDKPAAPAADKAADAVVVGSPARIEVFPTAVKLDGPGRSMHLVTSGYYADGGVQDLTSVAELTSKDEKVARVEGGLIVPLGNGRTEVAVKVGGQEVNVPVEVANQEVPDKVSFNYGTLAVLSKHGCNSGACHGSPSGKGGFRMSLRAYDSALDIETLVREAFNRRTNLYEPEMSLLLRKPLMEIAHGGGRRLKKSDLGYALLRDWIAQGCQADAADAPTCVKLEVYPRERILKRPAHTQQIVVLAQFSDGSIRDVTSLAVFSSSDDAVATVDAGGLVVGQDRGEAAILVRFLDKIETASMMFLKEVPGFKWTAPPENNFVDHYTFRETRAVADPAFGFVYRRGVRAARLSRRHRRAARARRDDRVSFRRRSPEARQADRSPARAARVRRVLGLEVGRPAADSQSKGHAGRRPQVQPLAGGGLPRQHALRPVRPAVAHGRGQHVRQSAGQLLPHGHRNERLHRNHVATVPGHPHPVRQVPQPPL